MTFYGYILLGSVVGPLLLSFDKKVAFYKQWGAVFAATLIVAIPFIVWDAVFNRIGVWGFTDKYVSEQGLWGLPIEEILFFVVVPYCCLFIHAVLKAYFRELRLHVFGKAFLFLMIAFSLVLIFIGYNNYYTCSACVLADLLLILAYFTNKKEFGWMVLSFLVCLVPFFVVNGFLTGMATDQPVVWYSENHIVGMRMFTIPVEDVFYNLCLFVPVVLLFNKINSYNK